MQMRARIFPLPNPHIAACPDFAGLHKPRGQAPRARLRSWNTPQPQGSGTADIGATPKSLASPNQTTYPVRDRKQKSYRCLRHWKECSTASGTLESEVTGPSIRRHLPPFEAAAEETEIGSGSGPNSALLPP